MDMRIDQAGSQDPAACIEEPGPGVFGARARRLHSGDAAGADPNFPLVMDALGVSRKHPSPGDHQVRGLPPHGHCGQALGQGMQRGDGETGQGAHAGGVLPGTNSVLDQKALRVKGGSAREHRGFVSLTGMRWVPGRRVTGSDQARLGLCNRPVGLGSEPLRRRPPGWLPGRTRPGRR